ncbi:MAG: hypothetical protein ACQERF_00365 [Actinomycetota bacterium]
MDEHACAGRTLDSLASVVAALEAARSAGAVVVGIDGRSGAGKTALAARLMAALPHARVLHLDDVYRGWWGLSRGLDHTVTFALAPLSRGDAGRFRPWDWATGRPGDWVGVPPLRPGELLLVEGCGAIAAPVDSYIQVGVWCRAPEEVRRARAMERDDWHWAEHWDQWERQEDALDYRRDADLCWDAAGD